ncbi:MAG: dihydrolipoyl dehydrogenase [Alphaproteobacteria bacterium]|nr:dihydrolipoyl dehydrogenase [Alphaproteobacteria bacterium]
MKYDVIVIGGGPGGYVAAIRAAQLGLKPVVIEKADLGGVCLNWGCIPTKALLRSSEVHHLLQNADQFGIKVKGIEFDIKKIVERSRNVAKQLSSGITHLMKKNKVEVIKGTAKILSAGKVSVSGNTITGNHIIIATGARARVLPGFEPDGDLVMTYREAMVPKKLPKKLLVVGSGAIGVEFASFYKNLGSEVTIVEIADRILPVEDKEISSFMQKEFESQGMKILVNSKLESIKKGKSKVEAKIVANGKSTNSEFDSVIMAVGIQANTEELGLENTKVKLDKGNVVINQWCETSEKGIYAIGDVAGAPWLAHKASHEGIICVEKIAKVKHVRPMKKNLIPGCTYSMPQVASVGLTEDQAKKEGHKIKVGKFPFVANGKAIAVGDTNGFVKTIFHEKTGELLGAHMVGPEVTEMIQGYVVAMNLETTEEDLMHTIFPHPTLSESMHESVLNAFGKSIHI